MGEFATPIPEASKPLDLEHVRRVLAYEADSGKFIWLESKRSDRIGQSAGARNKYGHIVIRVGRYGYMAHRLAFFYLNGEWPTGEVDHINGDPSDNRLSNLRIVRKSENLQNRYRAKRGASGGLLGVKRCGRRWVAAITLNYKTKYLGCFGSPEEAHDAYLCAKRDIHPFGEIAKRPERRAV